MSAPSLKFAETSIPAVTVGRPAEPNPFSEVVGALASGPTDDDGRSISARSVTVPAEDVKPLVSKLHAAGEPHGVTVRKTVDDSADDGTATITFWTVPRITRPRKQKGEAQD